MFFLVNVFIIQEENYEFDGAVTRRYYRHFACDSRKGTKTH